MESLHLTQGPQILHCVKPWPSKNLRSTHAHARKLPKHNPSQKNSAHLHTDTALVVLTTDIILCVTYDRRGHERTKLYKHTRAVR